MEIIVPILLIVSGVLLTASVILQKMYNELEEDYKELAIQYYMEKEEKEEE